MANWMNRISGSWKFAISWTITEVKYNGAKNGIFFFKI